MSTEVGCHSHPKSEWTVSTQASVPTEVLLSSHIILKDDLFSLTNQLLQVFPYNQRTSFLGILHAEDGNTLAT